MGVPVGPHHDPVPGLESHSRPGLEGWSGEEAFGFHPRPGELVEHVDVGAAARQHPDAVHTVRSGVGPPDVDQVAHGVRSVVADVDAAGFGVVEQGSFGVSGSELVQRLPVEVVHLSLVHFCKVGDDSVAVGDDPVEQATRVD